MLRKILAVASGPIVYGVVCVPTTWLVVQIFSGHFDENWVTQNHLLLVLLVSLTVLFAGASGYIGAWIAGNRILPTALALCGVQLAIGIAVQVQSWTALPLWYHLAFFVLLVIGVLLGALLRHQVQTPRTA